MPLSDFVELVGFGLIAYGVDRVAGAGAACVVGGSLLALAGATTPDDALSSLRRRALALSGRRVEVEGPPVPPTLLREQALRDLEAARKAGDVRLQWQISQTLAQLDREERALRLVEDLTEQIVADATTAEEA